jgi:hypothetical protein
MRISLKLIPKDIMLENNLSQYIHNGYIYFQVNKNKGLYGLVQAGKLAYDQLLARLTKAQFYAAHVSQVCSFTIPGPSLSPFALMILE